VHADTNVARSVVCVTVCLYVGGTRMSCAKTAELIEMPFGLWGVDSCGFMHDKMRYDTVD